MKRSSRLCKLWIALTAGTLLAAWPLATEAQIVRFQRGDSNADGNLNLSDSINTLGYLFLGSATPPCLDAADANDDGELNLTDAVFGLGYLFLGGPAPEPPFGSCGSDPRPDALSCESYPPCGAPLFILKQPSKSSTIALSDDETLVAMSNPEDDSVSIFSTATNALLHRITTGDEPSAVVFSPDSKSLYVANRAAANVIKIWKLDEATPSLSDPIPVGSEPTGLALSPTGAKLFVAEWAEGRVSVIDTASLQVVDAITAPEHPRSIAVTNDLDELDDDETLIVPEFFGDLGPGLEATDDCRSGRVRLYNVGDLTPQSPIFFEPLDSGFVPNGTTAGTVKTSPNQLYSVAVSQGKIFVTSISASPAGPPVFNGNVYPVVYVGDLAAHTEDKSPLGTTNLARKVADALESDKTRFFLSEIVDLSFVAGTGIAYVLSRGADVVQRVSYAGAEVAIGSTKNIQIDIGTAFPDGTGACQNPTGIVVTRNATRAYVNCWVTRRLGVIDLAAQAPLTSLEASPAPANDFEKSIQKGRRFYFTGRGRWASEGWSSCGSCHPDGLTDNITWSFAAGPRQTTSMDGTFSHGAGPQKQRLLNWTAIFEEMHDFERNTRGVSGGKGAVTKAGEGFACGDVANEVQLAVAGGLAQPVKEVQDLTPSCVKDWNDIEAFTRTIRPPRGLQFLDAASVARGAALFGEPGVAVAGGGCVRCHGGPGWTLSRLFFSPSSETNSQLAASGLIRAQPAGEDSTGAAIAPPQVACVLRKVGSFGVPGDAAATDALEKKQNGVDRAQGAGGFNIPSLYGLSLGAPYLHHGQARSLEELFEDPKWDSHLRIANENFLIGAEADKNRQDLINFLLSIDASTAEQAPPSGADSCLLSFP